MPEYEVERLGIALKADVPVDLGLSVCKHITEVHGGWIWCESEPGNTVFFVGRPCEGPLQEKNLKTK